MTLAPDEGTAIYKVAYHPDGTEIATAGEDNVIRRWGATTGELLAAWNGHGEGDSGGVFFGTIDVACSPDGRRLATAGADGLGKIWEVASGRELLVLAGHTDGLHALAWSPDGR